MDADDNSPGTVYNAVSVTLLFGLLWRQMVRWLALNCGGWGNGDDLG